jgi:hypothetical protein
MQKFTDKEGHEWEIELTYGDVLRIKDESKDKFDLAEPKANDLGKRLDEDLALFWELLWFIVQPQAALVMPTVRELKLRGNNDAIPSMPGITAAEFGRRMAADCLVAADRAFRQEWRDFFHHLQRPEKAAALDALNLIHEATFRKVREKFENSRALQTLEEKVSAKVDQILTKPFEDLQASFDLHLSDTPGEISTTDTKDSQDTAAPS